MLDAVACGSGANTHNCTLAHHVWAVKLGWVDAVAAQLRRSGVGVGAQVNA